MCKMLVLDSTHVFVYTLFLCLAMNLWVVPHYSIVLTILDSLWFTSQVLALKLTIIADQVAHAQNRFFYFEAVVTCVRFSSVKCELKFKQIVITLFLNYIGSLELFQKCVCIGQNLHGTRHKICIKRSVEALMLMTRLIRDGMTLRRFTHEQVLVICVSN